MEKWLHNNKVVGIAAVLLAILLWVIVHLDEQGSITTPQSDIHSRTINEVQVTSVGLNEELFYIQSIEPAFVNIALKGKESTVNQVRPNASAGQNQIQLDLSGISEPGQHTIVLQSVGFPSGVEVTIYPATVSVIVEGIQSKEVPVEIEIMGEPAEGFIADIPIINPIRAIVNVPSSTLTQIMAVKAIVDISGAQEAVEVSSKLVAIDETGQEVEAIITPAVAHVIVPITSPFKTVPLQIRLINEPAEGYSVESIRQSESEITVYGSEAALARVDIYESLEIDLTGLESTQNYTLTLPLIDGVHQIKPAKVDVKVTIVPSVEKTLDQVPITLSGANPKYVTRILDPQSGAVDVIIVGAASTLRHVNNDTIQAIIDVSNLPQGMHELTVKLNLPSNVKYGGEEEIKVTVEIVPLDDVNDEIDMSEEDAFNDEESEDVVSSE